MGFDGIDWDGGNGEKCQKHGVSIREIEEVFDNEPMVLLNQKHDSEETRYHAVGKSREGRYIFIVFTERQRGGEVFIRPISARYMHKKEVVHYERQKRT